jgi:hypothetical protein
VSELYLFQAEGNVAVDTFEEMLRETIRTQSDGGDEAAAAFDAACAGLGPDLLRGEAATVGGAFQEHLIPVVAAFIPGTGYRRVITGLGGDKDAEAQQQLAIAEHLPALLEAIPRAHRRVKLQTGGKLVAATGAVALDVVIAVGDGTAAVRGAGPELVLPMLAALTLAASAQGCEGYPVVLGGVLGSSVLPLQLAKWKQWTPKEQLRWGEILPAAWEMNAELVELVAHPDTIKQIDSRKTPTGLAFTPILSLSELPRALGVYGDDDEIEEEEEDDEDEEELTADKSAPLSLPQHNGDPSTGRMFGVDEVSDLRRGRGPVRSRVCVLCAPLVLLYRSMGP